MIARAITPHVHHAVPFWIRPFYQALGWHDQSAVAAITALAVLTLVIALVALTVALIALHRAGHHRPAA